MNLIRLGIVGSGFGRKVLWPVFSGFNEVQVVALTGGTLKSSSVFPISGGSSEPAVFSNYRTMIEGMELDAVAFALPPQIQEEAALYAAKKGLHLFCEKPLVLNHSKAVELLEVLKAKKNVGVVDFEFRKIPVLKRMMENVARIGQIQSVEIEWLLCNQSRRLIPGSWKYNGTQGGGVVSSFGCHLVDLCSAMFGKLEVSDYQVAIHNPECRLEDGTTVRNTAEDEFHLELRNHENAPIRIHVNTAHSVNAGLRFRAVGNQGTLLLEHRNFENYFGGFDLKFISLNTKKEEFLEIWENNNQSDGRFQAVREVAQEFINAIRSSSSPECDLNIGVENSRLIADARERVATIKMHPKMLSVIIPAMNEAGTIHSVLTQYAEDLRKEQIPFEIVVINDIPLKGPSDHSSEILQDMIQSFSEIRAFDRTGGTGYGTAVSTAIELSKGDYVVISSADACNISSDIIAYYRVLADGNDAVFGSRFIAGASVTGYPGFKLWVNRLSNFLLQVLFGFKFNDYTDGFKGYRRELLNQFRPLFSTKFNITIELSLKAMLLTNRIKQIPTQWYGRNWGSSKLSILRVLRYYLSTLFYILGLRIVTEEFRKCARNKVEIYPVQARSHLINR